MSWNQVEPSNLYFLSGSLSSCSSSVCSLRTRGGGREHQETLNRIPNIIPKLCGPDLKQSCAVCWASKGGLWAFLKPFGCVTEVGNPLPVGLKRKPKARQFLGNFLWLPGASKTDENVIPTKNTMFFGKHDVFGKHRIFDFKHFPIHSFNSSSVLKRFQKHHLNLRISYRPPLLRS